MHAGAGVYESSVVVEYIDEAFGSEPSLMPASPSERARLRAAMVFVGDKIVPQFYRCLMSPAEGNGRAAAAAELLEGLVQVSALMNPSSDGPYFLGQRFSSFECILWPHYQRIASLLRVYRGFSVDRPELLRLQNWADATRKRPSVRRTIVSEERLLRNYRGYADGSATSDAAQRYAGARSSTSQSRL
eukprot:TRINITY_DN67056_c0_g1_i2.p1 TRINITY_DN67056_c0_g1~~TRINITY_DN67056_c0_g1_i2.p1  ORF type:complete len:188 (-),score=13.12 TRINITY_DN67056_c0_g1_i2:78-641(-)